MHYPSAELIACAWAKAVGGDIDDTKVATTLPADVSVWASTGFVRVAVAGPGAPGVHVPLQVPVVSFECWAADQGSGKAPWGQATALAHNLLHATYRAETPTVTMPAGFYSARLLSIWPVGNPMRIPGDEAGFARVDLYCSLAWTTTAAVA